MDDESDMTGSGPAGSGGSAGSGSGTPRPWGGRFSEEQAPLFERLNASIPYDHVLASYDIKGSLAHVRMLARIGVLSEEEKDQIVEGLEQVAAEVEAGTFAWSLQDEDIHMAIERRLTELVGPVGGKLHTGRSRNDQIALDLHLYLRDAVETHGQTLLRLMEALLEQAGAHRRTVFPGYTHLQRAQPVLLAHHLLAHFFAFEREYERFRAWKGLSWMPLGAGALAGVSYPLDREWVASELGFQRVALNAMDAVAARDVAFAYLAIAASCGLQLSRLAEEIVLWSSQEFGLVSLPERWTSGSSIMPQKRNPDAAELVRAKAAGFMARLQGLGALLKGLPLAYNKDLQEDKIYVFGTREDLDLCLAAMSEMVAGMRIDQQRARQAAEGGYAQATDVADFLVRKGVPFREAHRLAGRVVALVATEGKPLAEATLRELQEISPLFDEEYYQVVDVERVIGSKVSPGGTAPQRVDEQLSVAGTVLARLKAEQLGS